MHRNMPNLDKVKHILKSSQCKKKTFHVSTDGLNSDNNEIKWSNEKRWVSSL